MKPIFEHSNLHCTEHREQHYQFILLKAGDFNKRLLCLECLYSMQKYEWNEQLKDLIPLSLALCSPENLFNKMTNSHRSRYVQSQKKISETNLDQLINQYISTFEQLQQLLLQMKEQLKAKLQEFKERQTQVQNLRQELLDKTLFSQFTSLFQQLKGLDQQYKSDSYIEIDTKLQKTLGEMLKDNSALIINCINECEQKNRNLKLILNSPLDQLLKFSLLSSHSACNVIFDSIAPQPLTKELLIEKIAFQSKKEIKQTNLIYLGSRDGLNGESFWRNVQLKRNLLMILKSSSNNCYFGGYSPCQWDFNVSSYVHDPTSTSFLFTFCASYSEIYQVKQGGANAIYCHRSYGPIFGSYDLYLSSSFTDHGSTVGKSYQFDGKSNQNLYLYGGVPLKIGECEIYEICFI